MKRTLNTKDRQLYRRLRTCDLKAKFATAEAALAKTSQCCYPCPYCGAYHRTTRAGYINQLLPSNRPTHGETNAN